MAELSPAALNAAADMRRRELPAAVALAILTGGLAAAIMGVVTPVGWAAAMGLLLIADAEIYRRLDVAGRPLPLKGQLLLAAWAFFNSAAYAALPAALWLDGAAAGAAAAMILWVAGVVRHLGRGGGAWPIAAAGAAPPALSLIFAPLAIAVSAHRPDWDLAVIAAVGGAALMVYVAQARISATEAERALEAAARNEDLQRTLARLLLDQTALHAFLLDRDGRILAASQSGGDMVGRRFEDACVWTPLRWREAFARALEGERTARQEEESFGGRWMAWEARPWRDVGGLVCGVLAFGRDITDMVEARRAASANGLRLSAALTAARGVVWEIDAKHHTVDWFGDAAPIYGRAFGYDAVATDFAGLVPEEDRPLLNAHFEAAAAGVSDMLEHRVLRPDGEISWVQITTQREMDAAGHVRKLIVLTKDITERKHEEAAFLAAMRQAEDTLRAKRALLTSAPAPAAREPDRTPVSVAEMYERLRGLLDEMDARDAVLAETLSSLRTAREAAENANVSKSQFLASMSHELRTPLNAIIGYSEILLEEASDDGRESDQKDIERVLGSARQLLHLINGILDLSKIEAGRMDVSIAEFDVARLVQEAAAMIRPAVERGGSTLKLEIEGDLGVAQTDAFKLNQCLLNLLSNAAKFTKDGVVTLRARRETRAGADWIEIAVRDTGIGLNEEQLSRLFQPFMQAEVSTARKYGGSGLGLAITRRMMGLLGGEVTVTSRIGEGSTFVLRAPAKRGDAASVHDADIAAVAGDGEGHMVLVIDDEESARDLAARSLARLGFSVREAHTGEAGLAMARSFKPHAILLDINLPDISGWEVIEALAADPDVAGIPIIVHSVDDDRQRALSLGACAHLVKPADRDVLAAMVARFARPRRASASSQPTSTPAQPLAQTGS